MLAHLLKVDKRVFQSPTYRCHATQGCTLELLALEERLSVLEEADIVSRDGFNEVFGGRQLAKGYSKMVGIVEGIQQILVERMYILKTGETLCFDLVSLPQLQFRNL